MLFCPEFLQLFSGSKNERLKFFDRFLIQISPQYRNYLLKANRAHRHKTRLLRAEISPTIHDLYPWNAILAENLPFIIQERKNFLKAINPLLQKELKKISQKDEFVKIIYETSENIEPEKDAFLHYFKKNFQREIIAQRNFLAPNRDDFGFYLREKPILKTASRGEERSVLLAFLSAQKYYLKEKYNENPILLLDDVFSELDNDRQKYLEYLCQGSQVFFTTTHKEHFRNFFGKIQKIEIK